MNWGRLSEMSVEAMTLVMPGASDQFTSSRKKTLIEKYVSTPTTEGDSGGRRADDGCRT